MSCMYSNFDGQCELWDDDDIQVEHIVMSCDEEGHCVVEDDDDPSIMCEDYEER